MHASQKSELCLACLFRTLQELNSMVSNNYPHYITFSTIVFFPFVLSTMLLIHIIVLNHAGSCFIGFFSVLLLFPAVLFCVIKSVNVIFIIPYHQ